MKVLFITTAYPTSADDPRGAHVHRLARSLVRRGHTVTVVAPGSETADRISIDGVNAVLFRYWGLSRRRVASGVGGIVPAVRERAVLVLQLIPLVVQLARFSKREIPRHDLVHSHWIVPSALIARFFKPNAHVATAHGADVNILTRGSLGRKLMRFALATTSCNSAVSDDLGSALRKAGCERVHLTPLGVEVSHAWSAHPDRSFDLVFVGSLTHRKNVQLVLRALGTIEDRGRTASLAIVGDGPLLEELQSMSQTLSSNVEFTGEVAPPKAIEYIRNARFLVLPSTAEGRPTVVLEAMANGTVVLASRIPGTEEMVEDGVTGHLFDPDSADDLADLLQRCLWDTEAAEEVSRLAHQSLIDRQWTVEDAAGRFERIYIRALEGI